MSDDLPPDLEDFSDRFASKLEQTRKLTPENLETEKPPNHGGLLEVPGEDATPLVASGVPFKHTPNETKKSSTMPVSLGEGADIQPASEGKGSDEADKKEEKREEPKFLTGWGTPEQEAIQKMMIDASLANTPDAKREMREFELNSVRGYLKKTSLKGGFLNRGKKKVTKKKTPTKAATVKTADKEREIIEVKVDPAKAAAERNALLSKDVQEQLRSQIPAMEKKLTDGSWMTEDFLEKVSKDKRLLTGMSNPRWMEALQRMRTEPEVVMNEYKHDKGFQDWIMAFMGIMGEQFTELGKKEDKEEEEKKKKKTATAKGRTTNTSSSAATSASASSSAGPDLVPVATRKVAKDKTKTSPSSASAKVPPPIQDNKDSEDDGGMPSVEDMGLDDDEEFDSISVVGVEDQTIVDEEGWGSDSSDVSVSRAYGPYIVPQPFARPGTMFDPKKGLLAPDGPSSNVIASAAKAGAIENIDDDVRQVLANPELVETLRDPEVHRMLEECRMDGRAMRKYANDPKFARRLLLLQNAGLIRIEF